MHTVLRWSWLLVVAVLPACRPGGGEPPSEATAGADAVPAAVLPPGAVDQVLLASRNRQAALSPDEDLALLERRFARMNLVALGRNPDGGTPIYATKNESPEFRQLARLLRDKLGDGPVDVLGERLADRGIQALVDERGVFRVPLVVDSFQGPRPAVAALEILSWTRDLPFLLAHHDLVAPGNRSVLPAFTLRTLLRARWNLETGRPQDHAFSDVERIAWLEFRGRCRTWAPVPERRQALEELARLLPTYPLSAALEALARTPPAQGLLIREE